MTACQSRELETRPNQLVVLLHARAICEGRCNCPANSSDQQINSPNSNITLNYLVGHRVYAHTYRDSTRVSTDNRLILSPARFSFWLTIIGQMLQECHWQVVKVSMILGKCHVTGVLKGPCSQACYVLHVYCPQPHTK